LITAIPFAAPLSEAKIYLPSGLVVTAKGEPVSEISSFGGLVG